MYNVEYFGINFHNVTLLVILFITIQLFLLLSVTISLKWHVVYHTIHTCDVICLRIFRHANVASFYKNMFLTLIFNLEKSANTALESSVTWAIISTLSHRKNLCARRNGGKQTWACQESYGWLWKERMDNKTSIRLQLSKPKKRSLTCAVTGCTSNEYNLEVRRDSLCEIHH